MMMKQYPRFHSGQNVFCPMCGFNKDGWGKINTEYQQESDTMLYECHDCGYVWKTKPIIYPQPKTCLLGRLVEWVSPDIRMLFPILFLGFGFLVAKESNWRGELPQWGYASVVVLSFWWMWFTVKHTDWMPK